MVLSVRCGAVNVNPADNARRRVLVTRHDAVVHGALSSSV